MPREPALPVSGAPLINVEGGDLTIESAAFSGHATGEVLRVTGGAVRVVNSSFMGRTRGAAGGPRAFPADGVRRAGAGAATSAAERRGR